MERRDTSENVLSKSLYLQPKNGSIRWNKKTRTHTHIEKLVSSVVSRRQINVWDYERDLGGVVVAAAAAAGMTTSATAHIECVGNVSRKLVQCE